MAHIDFEKEYILENKIVRISSLKENDFDNLVGFAINEPELWTHSLIQANSPKKMKVYINKALEDRENRHNGHLWSSF